MNKKIITRIFIVLGNILGFVLVFILLSTLVIVRGPSKKARDIFVLSAMESSAGKILAQLYLSNNTIEEIQDTNTIVPSDEITDGDSSFVIDDEELKDKIEIKDVKGPTFRGKMMVVYDPSRVSVASIPKFTDGRGMRVVEMAESESAVAAINGGSFFDDGGFGNGGMPLGVVIDDGVLRKGDDNKKYNVIGFDNNHNLIVGYMTGKEAMDREIRDAVSFGPILITNGVPAKTLGSGGGLNPRTVIGQRDDGAVLMLVIDGRQPHSLGASYKDCIDVMLDFGAINAANLDGGSSSTLYYQGEILNISSSLYGPRSMPTAFIVK